MRARTAFLAVAGTLGCACGEPPSPPGPPTGDGGRRGVVAFGGDTILARRVHFALRDGGPHRLLSGLRGSLRRADVALVNLECVLSDRGAFWNRRVRRQHTFRGRPELVRVLTGGGIDVVTLANNHAGDYGPDALLQSLRILDDARIAHVGAGATAREARAPALFRVGDAVVGFVAATAVASRYAVEPGRPGTNYLDPRDPDDFVETVAEQVRRARRHAHVVLFTVHWGKNFEKAPTEEHRVLARRLVREAGVDAILGHSAHVVQGVEIVDGRPVIYDAGNLFTDFVVNLLSALFRLEVDRNGVRRVEAFPIRTWASRTHLASDALRTKTLAALRRRSAALGTKLVVERGRGLVASLRPKHARLPPPERWEPPAPVEPSFPDPDRVPPAAVSRVPPDAKALRVPFENGMELLGYEIETPRVVQAQGAIFTTYWRAHRRIADSTRIRTQVVPRSGRGGISGHHHEPGDYSWPTTRWRPGQIVADRVLVRTHRCEPGPHHLVVSLETSKGVTIPPEDPSGAWRDLGVRLGPIEVVEEGVLGCGVAR